MLLFAALVFWVLSPADWAAQQMLLHVFLMTIFAPALAYVAISLFGKRFNSGFVNVWTVALIQALLFLYWHSPVGMAFGMRSQAAALLLQSSLLFAATCFWWQLLSLSKDKTWQAVLALLATGKLFCLVALLMTFAPRSLYPAMSLEQQQLAGLIMVVLCPLCYVATSVWLFWCWLRDMEQASDQTGESPV